MGFFGGSDSASAHLQNVYTLAEVPGKKAVKAFGLVQYVEKGLAGDMPKKAHAIPEQLWLAAKELGANAVLNMRLVTGSYQQQGSQWMVTYVIAYGDAVILADA